MPADVYELPLTSRYASREMAGLWSEPRRIRLWRELWIVLAESQRALGLPISAAQIAELKAQADQIDFAAAAAYERRFRHDVMAHVHAYGDLCPSARGIIHWGATSCYVTDNADLILIREGLQLLRRRIHATLARLAGFIRDQRHVPCLGATHLQPAQPTTVGKRACLWAYDLVLDLRDLEHRLSELRARSVKGTTGTQASFLQIFQGDHAKVRELEQMVAERIGFANAYAVTGQTYPRKVDAQILAALSGIAQSAHKAATDWRILVSQKELDEPSEPDQIGSSAMAYKRNPMRSERLCALARFVSSLESSAVATASTQWLERTLDDSANRRLVLPQAFLATDAVLLLYDNIMAGMRVYPRVCERRLREELPFMATERLLMAAVEAGIDRQEAHERIRIHSLAAAQRIKDEDTPNDLRERLANDPLLGDLPLGHLLHPANFVGRAPEQAEEFLEEVLQPILAEGDAPGTAHEISV